MKLVTKVNDVPKVPFSAPCPPLSPVRAARYSKVDMNIMNRYDKSNFGEGLLMIPTDRIEINPKVCNGRPVIKGTRIPVSVILEQIAEGESWDTLLAGYPELKKEDIQAALLYARASLDHTEIRAAYA
jgi:uncharacterized protein (DUF433 family)